MVPEHNHQILWYKKLMTAGGNFPVLAKLHRSFVLHLCSQSLVFNTSTELSMNIISH